MKVYRRLIIDIETDYPLVSDWQEYDGPIALASGGGPGPGPPPPGPITYGGGGGGGGAGNAAGGFRGTGVTVLGTSGGVSSNTVTVNAQGLGGVGGGPSIGGDGGDGGDWGEAGETGGASGYAGGAAGKAVETAGSTVIWIAGGPGSGRVKGDVS